jgi:hypothetical protein
MSTSCKAKFFCTISTMTKTKDFISTIPQATTLRNVVRENVKRLQEVIDQPKSQNELSVKSEVLSSADSDDSGDSGDSAPLQVFTSINDLPANKVIYETLNVF